MDYLLSLAVTALFVPSFLKGVHLLRRQGEEPRPKAAWGIMLASAAAPAYIVYLLFRDMFL